MSAHKSRLSHVNQQGEANMVDVSDKSVTHRQAIAVGRISMLPDTFELLQNGEHAKGDVFAVARIAGIQAAKKCSELIPLCHPLMLSKVQVDFEADEAQHAINVRVMCKLAGQTGVEMEALTGASVALLTLYDMCKAVDPGMQIEYVRVEQKQGGKTGQWIREQGSQT